MVEANLERLRSIEGVKWTKHGPDVLPAWVADMDFTVAPEITAALRLIVDQADHGYNFGPQDRLIPTWVQWQADHHGWSPPEDECQVFTGALHALEALMVLHSQPGDGAVVFSPIYHPFRKAIEDSGRSVVDVPLDAPGWRLDAERFAAAIDPRTRVVLFCQPHNPLGRVFDVDELTAFAEVVEQHNLLVISDEIWGDLTHDGHEHLPLARAVPQIADRIVTLGSASKAFSLAALRCAVAHIGPPHLRRSIAAFPTHLLGGPSTISAVATVTAWTQAEAWLTDVRAAIAGSLDHLEARVAADLPGVTMHRPQATYLAWLDFSASSIAGGPAKFLFKEAGVALEPGEKFGPQATHNARLNFATSIDILDTIIDRCANAMATIAFDPEEHT